MKQTSYLVPAMQCRVDRTVLLPGSKSHANRAIICACLSEGTTIIRNATPCDDVAVMVRNLQAMGFNIEWMKEEEGTLTIIGGIPAGKNGKMILDCENAGTTLRFLTSVACLVPGEWVITGNAHMLRRPILDLITALRSLGAMIDDTDGALPISVRGGELRGGKAILNAEKSSQYLSSLLLVGPRLPLGLTVECVGKIASAGYVDLTRRTMQDFGAKMQTDGAVFTVSGSYRAPSFTYETEGDWSAAGPWFALEAITGSSVTCANLPKISEQSDRLLPAVIERLRATGDIVIDASEIPDQVMNIAVVAACRRGKTTVVGVANLRVKECDRLHVVTTELRKAGVEIAETADGLIITGFGPLSLRKSAPKPVSLDPHDDHRMVMCFAVFGALRGGITITNPECVTKSYPSFISDLEKILKALRPIVIVGMRGVGKSALGRKLASKLKLKHLDSDRLFVDRYGDIRSFIEAHGWPDFRKKEEEVIASNIRNGAVLSLGGGATESKPTRDLIKKKAICVWLQASEAELVKRLSNGKRPSLTALPLAQEVAVLLKERSPHYQEVAHVIVAPHLPFKRQVPSVISFLRNTVSSYDLHVRSDQTTCSS